MNKKSSLIYVNFAPYINTGSILDYVLDHFELVIVFCFNFHKLGKGQDPSMVTVFRNKKIISHFPLYQNPTPAQFVFFLLPLRSVIIFIQLFFHTFRLQRQYGSIDYFFTVNAFCAWCGNILRAFGMVKKTIFWVWDYYPPKHLDPMIRFMRWLYWQFDKPATKKTDRVIFLNRRMADLRQSIGVLSRETPITTIGIGTNLQPVRSKKNRKEFRLVFFGVVKKRHGLDLVFESALLLSKQFPNLTFSVIGGGPDLNYYKRLSRDISLPVNFHGFIKDERQIDALIQQSDIGIAPYINDESSVSQYTDPSKIKRYISNGLPVIATDVFEFSAAITHHKAGIIISHDPGEFVRSIRAIKKSYATYQNGAINLAKHYYYKKLYAHLFLP